MSKVWSGIREAGRALTLVCLALAGASCGDAPEASNANVRYNVEESEIKKGVVPQPDAEAAVVETDFGKIVIELYPNLAPQAVERFKRLVGEGFYNGTAFHRVNPQVGLIQGGDPLSKDDDPSNDGTGDSPYPNLPAEFSDVPYVRGTVGAARTDDVNSANCQFFVALKRIPEWDKRYTVFGRVIQGINVADIVSNAPIAAGERESPDPKVIIKSVTLQPRTNFGSVTPAGANVNSNLSVNSNASVNR